MRKINNLEIPESVVKKIKDEITEKLKVLFRILINKITLLSKKSITIKIKKSGYYSLKTLIFLIPVLFLFYSQKKLIL